MKGQDIQKIRPAGGKSTYETVMWGFLPVCLLYLGVLMAYRSSWGGEAPEMLQPALLGLVSLVCMAFTELPGRKLPYLCLLLLPWLPVFFLGGSGCLWGQAIWINALLARWNGLHEAGIGLLIVPPGVAASEAALGMAVLQAELVWILVYRRQKAVLGVYLLLWQLLLLLLQAFSPLSCALMLAGFLGSSMAGVCGESSGRIRLWTLGAAAVLCVGALTLPGQELTQIRLFRENAARQLHELRYGADHLPEGELRAAGQLLEENGILISVQSDQKKSLYLKGFVGSVLEDGSWKTLPDSAYGGSDAGILDWLAEKHFDPLTQTAQYYSLADQEERSEYNRIQIRVWNTCRYYSYLPGSLEQIEKGRSREKKDQNLLAEGLLGQRFCVAGERSGHLPSELTVPEEWVSDPQTEARRQYCEAEAVYRDFVYRHYTRVDEALDRLMERWFWEDYETGNDGIYSAVGHIRQKLTEGVSYTERPAAAPEGEEPVHWFLTRSREGNAVQYASAAVEALRSHGIPARYVEGYYIPEASWSAARGDTVYVTGREAHAWAEVYFDGIGWMPVDVTPGYYYDAVQLEQLVGMPDEIHKTAALEDKGTGADDLHNPEEEEERERTEARQPGARAVSLLPGIAAVLLILCTLLFSAAELLRGVRMLRLERRYRKTGGVERAVELEKLLFSMLALLGIDARLGWETQEIDRRVAERCPRIEPGEYLRACRMIEKAVYGGMPLEAYEERTLFSFLDKLAAVCRTDAPGIRLRFRYLVFRF